MLEQRSPMRRKFHGRFLFKAALFAVTLLVCTILTPQLSIPVESHSRRLLESESKTDLLNTTIAGRDALSYDQIKNGGVVLYIFGAFYMFVSLAIVCDEFFVPSLEILSERLGLSNEVAGATLMAAGGSAPELFTSFIGTFQESAVGFSTIVGSAVFNVLFVIAMCAIFSRELLSLSWWPLFRDSIYYTISLLLLALFFTNDVPKNFACPDAAPECKTIEAWEAGILFALYFGYVGVMAVHVKIYNKIQQCRGLEPVVTSEVLEPSDEDQKTQRTSSIAAIAATRRGSYATDAFVPPGSTFRVGLTKFFMNQHSVLESAGVQAVLRIQGDVRQTFDKLDKDHSGYLDETEVKTLVENLQHKTVDEATMKTVMAELDKDKNNQVSWEEFQEWYLRSETRISYELEEKFVALDVNNSGDLDKEEIKTLLTELRGKLDSENEEEWADKLFTSMNSDKEKNVTFEEFLAWYKGTELWQQQVKRQEDDANEAEGFTLEWPSEDGWKSKAFWLFVLPITAPLYFSMYFLRPAAGESRRTLCSGLSGFLISIVWIGLMSYVLVWWIEITGATFNIPIEVMGLTFLAAGTSVPDLLSSVIVARMGEGDMAVSSSLGSNIFDVLVGLPLPWLIYAAYEGGPVVVVSKGVGLSILILVLMLVLVIVTIAASGWKMTKTLGYTMILFYIIFVTQDLLRTLVFNDK